MRSRDICTLLFTFSLSTANAAPEIIGTVHPVIEPDMVTWMKERAAKKFTPERLEEIKHKRQQSTREYAERPPGMSLPRTQEPATHWFDPSVTVPYDLRDHEGRLIHSAGTTINPLDWRPLTRQLLFIDGDDTEQLEWAESLGAKDNSNVKVILVSGAPLDIGRMWHRQVFFDQQGLLVSKFEIKQVPAVVRQDGRRLRIDEVHP